MSANILTLIEPALLSPPRRRSISINAWLRRLRAWSERLSGAPVDLFLPLGQAGSHCDYQSIRDALAADPNALAEPVDVMRLIGAIQARAQPPTAVQPASVVWDELEVDPEMVCQDVSTETVDAAREEIARLSLACSRGAEGAVIVEPESVTHQSQDIRISGRIALMDDEGDIVVPGVQQHNGSLSAWYSVDDFDATIDRDWTRLVDYPRLGVHLAYRLSTPEPDRLLHPLGDFKFEPGDAFSKSLRNVGFATESGRLKRAFRAMAQIASGRANYPGLDARPYQSANPSNRGRRQGGAGPRMYRGTISRGASAYRLFWWAGAEPVFIAVAEHDGDPPV